MPDDEGQLRSADIPSVLSGEEQMKLGEVCVLLLALFAFATLILKVVEVSRHK